MKDTSQNEMTAKVKISENMINEYKAKVKSRKRILPKDLSKDGKEVVFQIGEIFQLPLEEIEPLDGEIMWTDSAPGLAVVWQLPEKGTLIRQKKCNPDGEEGVNILEVGGWGYAGWAEEFGGMYVRYDDIGIRQEHCMRVLVKAANVPNSCSSNEVGA